MRTKRFLIDDLNYLLVLLKTSLPLSSCLKLIETKYNSDIINNISIQLDKGMMIEDVIQEYLPANIRAYLVPMISDISFRDALDLSLSFDEKYMAIRKKFLSEITYPCLLLLFAVLGLVAFDSFGLDSIISILKMFGNDGKLFDTLRIVFRICVAFSFILLMVGILLLLHFSRKNKQTLAYVFISKYCPDSLLHIFFCQEFISLFLICMEKGYKTKDSLELLKRLDNRPIISFLGFHMDESLLKGNSLKEASDQPYFDTSLSRFIKIGSYSMNFDEILKSYVLLANERIAKSTKKMAIAIQISVYAFVGILITLIYQILFMPMKALASF